MDFNNYIFKIEKVVKNSKKIILYVFFGALTTIINTFVYYMFYNTFGVANVLSATIAWVLAVLFAFVSNKTYVFKSKTKSLKVFFFEIVSFFSCRFGTGLLDIIIMFITVDIIYLNPVIMKLISNVVQTVVNYIISNYIIFNKKDKCISNEKSNYSNARS